MLVPVRFLSARKFSAKVAGREYAKMAAFDADGMVYNLFLEDSRMLPPGIGFLDRIDVDLTIQEKLGGGYSVHVDAISNHQPTVITF